MIDWTFIRTLPRLGDSFPEEVQDWVLRSEAERRISELEAERDRYKEWHSKAIKQQVRIGDLYDELEDKYDKAIEAWNVERNVFVERISELTQKHNELVNGLRDRLEAYEYSYEPTTIGLCVDINDLLEKYLTLAQKNQLG